jgi:hypothetical protein
MLPIILAVQTATFQGIGAALLPLVIVALLIDSALVTIWYMLGSILGNAAAKASARSELYQVGGTALLAVLLIALLTTFSLAFYNILSSTKLLNPSTVSSICQGIMSNSGLTMLGSKGAIMSSSKSGSSSPFPGFCDMVDPAKLQTPTAQMDYPLAVTGVIVANLTNQTITNLNSAFVLDSFLGFLSTLQPEMRFCVSDPEAIQCVGPVPNILATSTVYVGVSFIPYAGFDYLYKSLADFGTMLTNAYTLFVAQLTFIVVFVFLWPYLVFIGLVLRSTPFTRGVGGLLIATAIGMALFYPLVYSIEYLSLNNWSQQQLSSETLGTANAIYGYNYVTSIPGRSVVMCPGEGTAPASSQCACSSSVPYKPVCTGSTPYCSDAEIKPTCNYTVNFFVQPSVANIAQADGCWPHIGPWSTDLITAEAADIGTLLVPLYSMFMPLLSMATKGFGFNTNGIPTFPLPAGCTSGNALKTFEAMMQSFGIIGVSAYLLPVLNLVITLSAILGLSGLLGGDTSLAGIAKLL